MPPLNSFQTWGRLADTGEPIEPKRRLFLVYEGVRTEPAYFDSLIDLLNRKRLPRYIAVNSCEKTDEDAGASNPIKLLDLAAGLRKSNPTYRDGDEIAIIFDADIYKQDQKKYAEVLRSAADQGIQAYVTFPSFELFLLLHLPKGFETWIEPNAAEILENKKQGGRRYLDKLFSRASGINAKRGLRVGKLADAYEAAIEQEGMINQDNWKAIGMLTSSVGLLIKHMIMN